MVRVPPTIQDVNVEVLASLVGAAGIVTGLVTGLAVRASERAQRSSEVSPPVSGLPAGVASVLSVLRSSAVVVDSEDRVLRASSAARAFGLVSGDRLMVDSLLAMARLVRRDGEIREEEIEVIHGRREGRWLDRKSTRLNSSHSDRCRMPSSA